MFIIFAIKTILFIVATLGRQHLLNVPSINSKIDRKKLLKHSTPSITNAASLDQQS